MDEPLTRRSVLALPAALLMMRSPRAAPAAGGDARGFETSSDAATEVLGKLGVPGAETMKLFSDAGMTSVAAHAITPGERAALEAVLRRTPRALLKAVSASVDNLNFVTGMGGYGSGLTRVTSGPGEPRRYEITLRSDIFTEDLGSMLTRKERLSLRPEEASRLAVLASRSPALRYVLTHEFAHVWEHTLDAKQVEAFRAGVWPDWRTLAPDLERSAVVRSAFRRHPPQAVQDLIACYGELVASPFVSLYATASAHEDFAETTSWAVLVADGEAPMQIAFSGDEARVFSPLSNKSARRRMDLITSFL